MKKISVLVALVTLLGMTNIGFSQVMEFFKDDFSKFQTNSKASWEVVDQNLYLSKTADAGGTSPELFWGYFPDIGVSDALDGTYYLISKTFSVKAPEGKTLNNYVGLKYNYSANNISGLGKRAFGIVAREKGGDWIVCSEQAQPDPELFQGEIIVPLPAALSGKDNVQIAPFVKSSKDNVLFLFYFDDVIAFGVEDGVYKTKLAVKSPLYTSGALSLELLLENIGNTADNFELSYQIDGGDVKTKSVTPKGALKPTQKYTMPAFSPEGWANTAYGPHTIKVWVSKINGEVPTEILYTEKVFNNVKPENAFAFRPMIEEFTSSTCPPCATLNSGVFNELFEANKDKMSFLKYQANFPGSGDPYYTEEVGVRMSYYAISAVPSLYINGKYYELKGTQADLKANLQNYIDEKAKEKAYFDIKFDTVGIDGENKIHISYSITTRGALENVRLQTAVMEKITTENASTNGETEFHHVMLKMIPGIGLDGNVGRNVSMKADTTYKYTLNVTDMGKTNMEDFTDLLVSCFIQAEDGTILQSATAPVKQYGTGIAAEIDDKYFPSYVCQDKLSAGIAVINLGDSIYKLKISAKIGESGTPVEKEVDVALPWGGSAEIAMNDLDVKDNDTKAYFSVIGINGQEPATEISTTSDFEVIKTDIPFKPIIEVFTSSKVDASKVLNEEVDPLYQADKDNIFMIKFPVGKDPYARNDNDNYSKSFADVPLKAPTLVLNGSHINVSEDGSLPSSYFEDLLSGVKNQKSIISLTDSAISIGIGSRNRVNGKINLESKVDGTYRVYLMLVEAKTTKNIGSNGETEFINTVHAVLPNASSGASTSIKNGKGVVLLNRTSISTPYFMENFDNLSIVAIVKDRDNEGILQTAQFPILNKVANEEISYNTLSVYPNPSSDYVYIKNLNNASVQLYNLSGVCLFSADKISGDYTLDVSKYTPGQYVIKTKEGNKSATGKLSIVR